MVCLRNIRINALHKGDNDNDDDDDDNNNNNNNNHTLRNNPEERSSHLRRGGSLKSLKVCVRLCLEEHQ